MPSRTRRTTPSDGCVSRPGTDPATVVATTARAFGGSSRGSMLAGSVPSRDTSAAAVASTPSTGSSQGASRRERTLQTVGPYADVAGWAVMSGCYWRRIAPASVCRRGTKDPPGTDAPCWRDARRNDHPADPAVERDGRGVQDRRADRLRRRVRRRPPDPPVDRRPLARRRVHRPGRGRDRHHADRPGHAGRVGGDPQPGDPRPGRGHRRRHLRRAAGPGARRRHRRRRGRRPRVGAVDAGDGGPPVRRRRRSRGPVGGGAGLRRRPRGVRRRADRLRSRPAAVDPSP